MSESCVSSVSVFHKILRSFVGPDHRGLHKVIRPGGSEPVSEDHQLPRRKPSSGVECDRSEAYGADERRRGSPADDRSEREKRKEKRKCLSCC